MNSIDRQYKELLEHILHFGVEKKDRTGTGTKSIFGWQIRHRMSEGFPLLTTKKMHFKSIVTELLWFLRGDTNIKYLVDNGCNIWNGDAYKRYYYHKDTFGPLTMEQFIDKIKTDDEFAKTWGELGPIYGKQWRSWKTYRKLPKDDYTTDYRENEPIDQIQNLIDELKTNPDSRRLMVSAWNAGELYQMVLPPCHYGFQVYTRELSRSERIDYWFKNNKPNRDVCDSVDESSKEEQHKYFDSANVPKRAISLMYNCRSQDAPLGTPFNIASYALLLLIIAKQVNMIPDELITNMGDCHIYLNQIDGVKEQLNRVPYELSTVDLLGEVDDIAHYEIGDIVLKNYQSHPAIKMPLSN